MWPTSPSIFSSIGIFKSLLEHSSLGKLYQSITVGLESPKTMAIVVMDVPNAKQ